MVDAAETKRKRAAAARKTAQVDAAESERKRAAAPRKTAQVAEAKKRKTAKENNGETKATKAGTGAEHKKEVKRRNLKYEAVTKRMTSFTYGLQPGCIQMLCRVIQDPTCILEKLSFGARDLTDSMLAPILEELRFNQSVKLLGLVGSLGERVTRTTWHGIAKILRSDISGLVTLDVCNSIGLRDNEEDNQILLELCDALYGNKKLTALLLFDWELRFEGSWAPFSRLLCNKSSIADTFSSNHTLQRVVHGANQPSELQELLEMNQSQGYPSVFDLSHHQKESNIARRKVIKVHFTGEAMDWAHHFDDMDKGVLPRTIAWMARGDYTMFSYNKLIHPRGVDASPNLCSNLAEELSFFYKFVRSMPLLFESGGRAHMGEETRAAVPCWYELCA